VKVNLKKAEAAESCFEYNPKVDKVHVTGDLQCFPKQNDAVAHARTLTDKTIDVFERNGEDVEFDSEASDSVTDEANTIPDHLLASVKRQTADTDSEFEKVQQDTPDEPVVANTPALSTDVSTDETPAPAATEETPAPAATEETPAPAATEETPAPAATEETPAPAATEETPAPAATEETPAPAATEETPAPATTEETPAPAEENITEKLTELVNEVENLLHLNKGENNA